MTACVGYFEGDFIVIEKKPKLYDILVVIVAFVPLIREIVKPTTEESIIITSVLLIMGILWFGWSYLNNKLNSIEDNKEDINILRKQIKLMKFLHNLDKRLVRVEEINNRKKGEIDPRDIMIVAMILLFYLYLRSIGYIS